MEWKKIGKKMLFPPVWLMVILAVVSVAALIAVFVKGLDESPIAYVVYVVAFYTLSVIGVFCGMVLPKRYKELKQKLFDHPLGNRYMTDAVFRTHVSLYMSLAVNLLYAGMNILSFILYRSMWFVVLAGYYVILSVMRFLLVRYVRGNQIGTNRLGELKRARLCAVILLLLNVVLSGAVLMILYQNKGFEYHGVMIYIMAMYTFYMTIHTIVDLVKYRKYQSPVMTTAKIISLSAALVSMLSLETAMFSQFGADMSPENQQLMIILTGAGVAVIVIGLSAFMIARTTTEMTELRSNRDGKSE